MNRNPVSCSDKDLVFAIGDLRFPCGEEAADWRRIVKDCPHLVHALAAEGDPLRMVCVFALPRHKKWWLQALVEKPSLAGAESAVVTFFDDACPDTVLLPEPRAEGDPPCGTNCAKCPSNRVRCQGCPTSWFYVADFAPEAEGRAPSGCPGPARGAKTF